MTEVKTDLDKIHLPNDHPRVTSVIVAVLTFLLYLPALRNGFVNMDDDGYVINNIFIRSFTACFKWAFTSFSNDNWHPLTWLSHSADYALWELDPFGHHLTSIFLHSLNSGLVSLLAFRLIELAGDSSLSPDGPYLRQSGRGRIAAFITGLLFGIHPLHVESTAWVSERKDLLCALFYILSVLAYLRHGRSLSAKGRERKVLAYLAGGHYLLSLLFFILALLCKPMAVTLPAVLLLLDWHPLSRFNRYSRPGVVLMEKIPFAVLSLLLSIITLHAQREAINPLPLPTSTT